MKLELPAISDMARRKLRFWAPAILAAAFAWLLLLIEGTPISRASGLSLAIFGFTASMRRMGFVASTAGGLTLALCPMFWSQAGGGVSQPETILPALAIGLALSLAAVFFSRRVYLGIGIGSAAFVLVFWSQLGMAHSLRLTGLATAWLIYLLVDMILQTNPRPGTKPPRAPKPWHTFGLLFLFVTGAINDPLVALFAPAILLSLFLSYARLPTWYWVAAGAALCFGVALLFIEYLLPQSSPLEPLGWRDAARWIELGELLMGQFGIVGALLAVLGLARLSRWYPPLGTVTVIAFAAYTWFGLVYFGEHREVLLLPLLMIQALWMTYAVNAFGQWVNKSLGAETPRWTHAVSALYFILPVILLWNILQS